MKRSQRILISVAVIMVVLFFFLRLVVLLVMQAPPELDVAAGRLADCPNHPACVSSQADLSDESHFIEPIPNWMPIDGAAGTIKIVMKTITGARLVGEDTQYLHYEIVLPPFGFVSDVEFYFPHDKAAVEVRSSSRAFIPGDRAIRYRVELIRQRFIAY